MDLSAGVCRSFQRLKTAYPASPPPPQDPESRAEVKGHSTHPWLGLLAHWVSVPAEPHSTRSPGNSLWVSVPVSGLSGGCLGRGNVPVAWAGPGTVSSRPAVCSRPDPAQLR